MRKMPFLRICLALVAGIFLNEFLAGQLAIKIAALISCFLLSTILFYFSRNQAEYIFIKGSVIVLTFTILGLTAAEQNKPIYDNSHYLNIASSLEDVVCTARVEQVKQNEKTSSYLVEIQTIEDSNIACFFSCHGKLSVISHNSTFQVGDLIRLTTSIKPVRQAKNAFVFDYKRYLQLKNIHGSTFTNDISLLEKQQSLLERSRSQFSQRIVDLGLSENTTGILKAMILGEKDQLGEMSLLFRKTGTSHVLAISGLHVGIITAILYFLFSLLPMRYELLKNLLIIAGIWVFCLISGAAPSTLRASIMITCFLIAKANKLKGFGYNFVFLAAFFMLVYNPNQIFDIGFQFSFLAILGILTFFKRIYEALILKGFWDKIWQMTVLSICAQIALTPLSLYYFHEFPILFIPTSLVAVPATFLIVSGGLLSLIFEILLSDYNVISYLLDHFVQFFIRTLEFFASFDWAVLHNLTPHLAEIMMYYLALTGLYLLFVEGKKNARWLFLSAFLGILASQFYFNHQLAKASLVVYAHKTELFIDVLYAGSVLAYSEENTKSNETWFRDPLHTNYHVTQILPEILSNDVNHEIIIENFKVLILNSSKLDVCFSDYDLLVLNTKIHDPFSFPTEIEIIDFANNEKLKLLNPQLRTNEQLIINI